MLKLDSYSELQREIICLLEENQDISRSNGEDFTKILDIKIFNLMKNVHLGELSPEFTKKLNKKYFTNNKFRYNTQIDFWEIYQKINHYIQAPDSEKPALLKEIKTKFQAAKEEIYRADYRALLDQAFVVSLLESNCTELIDLFYETFPPPPLSFFGPENQPERLVKREAERTEALANFRTQNDLDLGDLKLDKSLEEKIQRFYWKNQEEKITYWQRHIRAEIRAESDVIRVQRCFEEGSAETKETKARELLKDANTPYRPQGCSPELAERIVQAASKIKLFSSVTHLLSTKNSATILDDCLYGRENLIYSYIPFRSAALASGDVKNGDANVICLGPNRIDPRCLEGERTVGLELDVDRLTSQEGYQKNPTLFFKQWDLGYDTKSEHNISIKDMPLTFKCNSKYMVQDPLCTNVHLLNNNGSISHYAEIWRDLMISSNIEQMHQILILNFFRFLDHLQDKSHKDDPGKRADIYAKIAELKDPELEAFLLQLGKAMTCSTEFNVYGAYKIDLNALLSITIYNYQQKLQTISIEDLCHQLNNQNYDLLTTLEGLAPEILNSTRFRDLLLSRVHDPLAVERLQNILRSA